MNQPISNKPVTKPNSPLFSSGPCKKHPGWSLESLQDAFLGRAHRSELGRKKIAELLQRSRTLLQLPDDYRIAIIPGSDTGAMECAMWSLLGPRAVNVLVWESFGQRWQYDIVNQLALDRVELFKAEYGDMVRLDKVDTDHDTVFVWNGTSSGVKVPNADWIKPNRKGLTLCDATSAVFAMKMPWEKLDVTTFSWQKALGGEAAHGMLILSPRAVQRLEQNTPCWPNPKVFRLTESSELNEALFQDSPINTPSMIAVEDFLSALKWADEIGGLGSLVTRSESNFSTLSRWVDKTEWIDFLAEDDQIRSNTSVCLKIVDPWFTSRNENDQHQLIKRVVSILDDEQAAFDIGSYRHAPPGFRIWCGCTVEESDIQKLTPWLDWAYAQIRSE